MRRTHILLTGTTVKPTIDDKHVFVTIGMHCWGKHPTDPMKAFANAKANASVSANYFITRVVPKDCTVNSVDGSIEWSADHDAKTCPYCTVGKDIQVQLMNKS